MMDLLVLEGLPDKLSFDAGALVEALPALVAMPAGTGKTHLLAAAAKRIVDDGGRVLVLTHTNAGVRAVRARLNKFGVTDGVRVLTISSFAFRVARSYPVLGGLRVPKIMVPADSNKYLEAAVKVAESVHIKKVFAATYTHVLVDEYQDCNVLHHAFIVRLKVAIPLIGVFGDHLQAIFGFADRLPKWSDVRAVFPEYAKIQHEPYRWAGCNEYLGNWLLRFRDELQVGRSLDLRNLDIPTGVIFSNISGDYQGLSAAAFDTHRRASIDETVLIIVSSKNPNAARAVAGRLKGIYTAMEELGGKFMVRWISKLVDAPPEKYAAWLFDLTKKCHGGHSNLDLNVLRKRYDKQRTGADLLARSSKRDGVAVAIHALDTVVENPTTSVLSDAMNVIPSSSDLRLHSHEAWYDIRAVLRSTAPDGDDKQSLLDELARIRSKSRYTGRPERKRLISSPLLVKGLEYDHVIIADATDHAEINDFYVALTRARRTITILSKSDYITLKASPNGSERSASAGKGRSTSMS